MSVRKRDGSPFYWFSFNVGGTRYRGSTGETTRAASLLKEADERKKYSKGGKPDDKDKMTVGAACQEYWDRHAKDLPSARTILCALGSFQAVLGVSKRLDQVDEGDIHEYKKTRRKSIKPISVNQELVMLRAMVNWLRDQMGLKLPDFPKLSKQMFQVNTKRQRILTADEATRLFDALPDHLQPVFAFAMMTGVRCKNAFLLDWSQVDMAAGQITFMVKGKKGGKLLVLPITPKVRELLDGMGPKPGGRVFQGHAGGDMNGYNRDWYRALTKAGLEGFRWHDIRHTAASWMVRRGTPLGVVQGVLGHSSIVTTTRYAQYATAQREEALQSIAEGVQIGHILGTNSALPAAEA